MQSHQKTEFHLHGQAAFVRLFPELAPLHISENDLQRIAQEMAKRENSCTDSECFTNGLAIFGQFLAHDMTFEVTSKFRGINAPASFENHRSINLDLDCMYGQWTQDFLYDCDDREKLLLGECYSDDYDNTWQDLQRNKQDKAIIPDARNDENIIVSQMHALFIEFHNAMIEHRRIECGRNHVFKDARQQTIWYYQWLIIYEFLKKIIEPDTFKDIVECGPRYFTCADTLPLEFTGAAFRMGHSQTRKDNQINERVEKNLFQLGTFQKMEEYVDWHCLFDFGDERVQYAKKLDTNIERLFHDIPFIRSDNRWERSLIYRNLKRGVVYGLPSGEDVARRMGIEPIPIDICERFDLLGTPLWYYILKEAEDVADGEHLGPVGSRILGEVFYTVLAADDNSFIKLHPRWKPEIGRNSEAFDFVDMVNFVEQYRG